MNKALDEITKLWTPDPARLAREDVQKAQQTAREIIGFPGRIMGGSKSGYQKAFKANVAVFNSNICTKEFGKIWFGDLDLTIDGEKVKALAQNLGVTIYVLREHDARFENENNPQFDNYVASFTGEAISFGKSLYTFQNNTEVPLVEIPTKGRLSGKIVYKKEFRK